MTTLSRRTFIRVAGAGLGAANLTGIGLSGAGGSEAAATPTPGDPGPYHAPDMTPEPPGLPPGPLSRGFLVDDLVDWHPADMEDARYFRSHVDRREHIPAYAPTQAHPTLSPKPRYLALEIDYDGSSYQPREQVVGREGYVWTQRFWPYIDVWGTWHGQVTADVPEDVLLEGGPGVTYGLIDLPNPGFVEMGHLHGARVLGGWFWPRTGDFADYVQQRADGSYPVADAMITMRRYFGFDGFFINQEKSIGPDLGDKLVDMFGYLRRQDPEIYLCYYDAVLPDGTLDYQNRLNDANLPWLGTPDDRLVDSIFINYAWPYPSIDPTLTKSAAAARAAGFDPHEVGFAGVEFQKGGFNPAEVYGDLGNPGHEGPVSFAGFVDNSFWSRAGTEMLTVEGRARFRRLEQQFYSGPQGDPARSGRLSAPPQPPRTHQLEPDGFDGIAHSVVEKSTLSALPIRTTFGIGVGSHFRLRGAIAATRPWDNAGIGSLCPTWQYWTEEQAPLDAVTLDETDAWDGAHSLRIRHDGDLTVHLFKTDLALPASAVVSVRLKEHAAVAAAVLLTGDDDSHRIPLRPVGRAESGWREHRAAVPGGAAGRTVRRISLVLSGRPLDLRIGAVTIHDLATRRTPARPSGFRAEKVVRGDDTARVHFAWERDPSVELYDIVAVGSDGTRTWVGRSRRDRHYAGWAPFAGTRARFELVAVGFDGSRSQPLGITVNG